MQHSKTTVRVEGVTHLIPHSFLVVNKLYIENQRKLLHFYYLKNVQGGPHSWEQNYGVDKVLTPPIISCNFTSFHVPQHATYK